VSLDAALVPFDDSVPYRPPAGDLLTTAAPSRLGRRRTTDVLARRFGARIAGGLGSIYLSARERSRCAVRFSDGLWVHTYRDGIVVDTTIGASMAASDATTRDTLLADYTPRAGDTVVDAGAGNGCGARLFSRLVGPAGRVVAIEAHPATFRCLRRTVELNDLSNVDAVEAAVVGVPGPVLLSEAFGVALAVAGRRLDQILSQVGVDRVDLLTMNIAGAELSALAGADDWLSRVDNLVVSCHDFHADTNERMRTFAPVAALLRQAGFRLRTRPNDARPWIPYYLYASRG
jgi:FkbM family methyltransferase